MFRIAATALCLTASAATADTLVGFHHTHQDGYTGSFTNPINYRPNRAPGLSIVRDAGYNEANTVMVKRRRAGVTTGTSITPPQGITGTGVATSSGAPLVQLGENLPRY